MSGLWASGMRRRNTRQAAIDSTMSPSALTVSITSTHYASVLLMITLFAVVILLAITSDAMCPAAIRTRATSEDAAATAVYEASVAEHQLEKMRSVDRSHVSNKEQDNNARLTFPLPPQTNFSGILARSFDPWAHPLPCFEPEEKWKTMVVQNSPADRGFLFVKPYKTGSSTTSGINLRIARNVALRRKTDFGICKARFDHGPWYPAHNLFRDRIRNQSFLWTVIREPTKRLISEFFHFHVSRHKVEPTDDEFQSYILGEKKDGTMDYYLQTLYMPSKFNRATEGPIEAANRIFEDFDFIGISERMDETAVLLMMLLDLPMSDILFLSAKGKGGYDDGGGRGYGHSCTYIWPSFVSPGMQDFFDTNEEWHSMVQYDLELYKATNASMDLTIDALGRDLFESNLAKFKNAQSEAKRKCLPLTVFPCDAAGRVREDTDCLWNDSGCGVECLDEIAHDFGMS